LPSSPAIQTIGTPFIEIEQLQSTNSHAIDMVKANLAAHGTAYFAHQQTAGKGQHGKVWNTEPSSNIILSVVLDITFLPLQNRFLLSAAMAAAVHSFFSQYAGKNTTIKWTNDLYYNDSKAGGILIETFKNKLKVENRKSKIEENIQYAVVGIGININQTQFPEHLPNPISLSQITGQLYQPIVLAKEICTFLELGYQQLKNNEFDQLIALYNENLYKRNQQVRLKKGSIGFNCIVKEVNANGDLIISGAAQTNFAFGEVEWVIK
jgi:BirA family transcriptional regulator, biotin operon repressor / biotin---[acetyl-CoA-carboxylase] ligase